MLLVQLLETQLRDVVGGGEVKAKFCLRRQHF